jgi:hypothetical protein
MTYNIAIGTWEDENGKFIREATEQEMTRNDALQNYGEFTEAELNQMQAEAEKGYKCGECLHLGHMSWCDDCCDADGKMTNFKKAV